MRRAWTSLLLGAVIVGIARLLAQFKLATPVPFWVLLPGLLTGALAPDSGFDPEGDRHPWGPVSTTITYGVNVMIYTGLAYVIFSLFRWPRRVSSQG